MELFEKIQAFELDDNSANFKFSERLARENGWSKTYYKTSESLYKEKFGIFPPDDIRHHSQKRFSEIQFQRINLHRNWVIPKPTIKFLSQTLFFSCLPFIILQASPTKITLQTIILLIIFGLILYSASKNSTNKSNNSSGNSGCSSCVASYDSDGAESGCGGDSSCSGCGGCGGGD